MPSKKPGSKKPWSMYPRLHEDVSSLLEEDDISFDFYGVDESKGSTQTYDTTVMGRFPCYNRACASRGWSSKKIAITIRMYPGARYNARVYHQRCEECNWISRPFLDDPYADRVAYRLKKWSGVNVTPPPFSGQSSGHHQSDLCEGCRNGHCRDTDWSWICKY